MAGRAWTREETLAAFNLYCRTAFSRLHARNPDIIALAEILDRTPAAAGWHAQNMDVMGVAMAARPRPSHPCSGTCHPSRTLRKGSPLLYSGKASRVGDVIA
jgi:hypothetical protein